MAIDPEELGRIVDVMANKGYAMLYDVPKMLGLHKQTLAKKAKEGKLCVIRVGSRLAVTFEELERFKTYGNWPSGASAEEITKETERRKVLKQLEEEGTNSPPSFGSTSIICPHCGTPYEVD